MGQWSVYLVDWCSCEVLQLINRALLHLWHFVLKETTQSSDFLKLSWRLECVQAAKRE